MHNSEHENQDRPAPPVDVAALEALGHDVIASMQTMRELLAARTAALEECRTALLSFHGELMKEYEDFTHREQELCEQYQQRDAALRVREEGCAAREQELDASTVQLKAEQAEFVRKRDELEPRLKAAAAQETTLAKRATALAAQQQETDAATAALERRAQELAANLARTQAAEAQCAERAAELEARRSELDAQHAELEHRETEAAQRAAEATRRAAELQVRETEVTAQTSELRQRRATLDAEQATVRQAQAEATALLRELETAREHLAGLRQQVQDELAALGAQQSDLLAQHGTSGRGPAQPGAGLPKLPDPKARESLERFQKLCRDAKRKALGAL
jgi:chromosome segregation ATPase